MECSVNQRNLRNEIESIEWSRYDGPETYDSSTVASSLISLLELEDSSQANDVGDRLICAIGNNHAGTYYPAVLEALDIIIKIEKYTSSKACKTCALSILNDLYYFEPDVTGFNEVTAEELKAFVNEKLETYSDESAKIRQLRGQHNN